MTVTDALGSIALLAGVLMAVSPVLQVRRMFQTRSSRDFSLGYPTVLCVCFIPWLAYGISLGNMPMTLSNMASLTFMVLTISVALYFRREGRAAEAAPEIDAGG